MIKALWLNFVEKTDYTCQVSFFLLLRGYFKKENPLATTNNLRVKALKHDKKSPKQ